LKGIIWILFEIRFLRVPLVNNNRLTIEPITIDRALFYQAVKRYVFVIKVAVTY